MKKNKKSINYGKWGYLFILPFFIIYLIFSLIPLVDTVRYSFFEYFRSGIKQIGPNFIGLANYVSLLHSDMLKYGLNTLILWVIGFVPQIVIALEQAKQQGLHLPIVYNTGSYESPEALRHLEGLVDIYLPDLKYFSPDLSTAYSHAPDYFETACAAISEMYRQVGDPVIDEDTGLMQHGLIVRHLLLPGQTKDSKKILRYLHETYGDHIYISIMNQYTPLPQVADIEVLNRTVTPEEYDRVLRFAERIGIERGFRQEGTAASESFIPEFDERGL